jgi:cellulose synthase/poly-beta-1,6-N-acetylglucosamine synthase-like glycosyltransferase
MTISLQYQGVRSVSIVMLTFRHEAFVREALRSALSQEWESLEVIIADDASPDGTLSEVKALLAGYEGPHDVRILPSFSNLGIAGNWNRAVAEAKGDIIVAAAGDDIMEPGRVRLTAEYFAAHPDCQALYGNCRTIDEDGRILRNPWRVRNCVSVRSMGADPLWKNFGFIGATAAYRASLLKTFGPIDLRCGSEDTPCVVRAQLVGSAAVLPEVMVSWRRHSGSVSFAAAGGGQSRAAKLAAVRRKARGAFRDAQQISKDILLAVELSMRSAGEVRGALAEAAFMYHQNRLKFHLLHPRRRTRVVFGMIGRLLADQELTLSSRLALAAKRSAGLLWHSVGKAIVSA